MDTSGGTLKMRWPKWLSVMEWAMKWIWNQAAATRRHLRTLREIWSRWITGFTGQARVASIRWGIWMWCGAVQWSEQYSSAGESLRDFSCSYGGCCLFLESDILIWECYVLCLHNGIPCHAIHPSIEPLERKYIRNEPRKIHMVGCSVFVGSQE